PNCWFFNPLLQSPLLSSSSTSILSLLLSSSFLPSCDGDSVSAFFFTSFPRSWLPPYIVKIKINYCLKANYLA
ncbi:hypothetical protein Tsubulata_026608, partial [Turnera subulata]